MAQSNTEVAKAPILAFNDKNWDKIKESVTPTAVYDEVGTHRRLTGANEIIDAWKGWANALPDSRATIETTAESGDTVTIELTWKGTHTGPLQTPAGVIPATGRKIELRACQVVEVAGGKAKSIRQYFDMGTLLEQIKGQ